MPSISTGVRYWWRRSWALGAIAPVLALLGWTLDSASLKSWHPSMTAMNPLTAVCFLLSFLALGLSYSSEKWLSHARWLGYGLASLAGFRLVGYFAGWEWGPDTWLFASKINHEAIPNRMAPNTALAFCSLGLAIGILDRPCRRFTHPAELLSLVAGSIGLVTVVGYFYQVTTITRVATHIPMALPTALLFVLCAGVTLRARPKRGLFSVARKSRIAGLILSRLLWVFIPVPVLVGYLEVRGVQLGLFPQEIGIALFALVLIGVQTYVALRTAVYVAKVDELRREAEAIANQAREESRRARLESEHQTEMLERLAKAAEYRDDDTGMHTRRVGDMAAAIAAELGLTSHEVEIIGRAAPLHDLGKIGISDLILLKPGKLTNEEYETMKGHTLIGAQILAEGKSELMQMAATIARTHHERWDGRGYPLGLSGDEIPLCGRIVAIADVFDALTNERPYKKAWTIEEALEEIQRGSGSHFDPDVVAAFLRVVPWRFQVSRAA